MSTPLVSIIVVLYRSEALLTDFGAALARHTADTDYELILVDNQPQHDPRTLLDCPARWIPMEHNVGYGGACNRGVAEARGSYVVCMNPDVIVTTGWLPPLLTALATHAEIALIAPESPLHPTTFVRQAGISDRPTLSGAVIAARRHTWQQLGGFDELIFLYWEDTELCWRAQALGYRTVVATDSLVIHHRGGSGGGAHQWRHQYIQNGIYTHLKVAPLPRLFAFVVRQCLSSLWYGLYHRDPRILAAWWWNLRHLRSTWDQRRRLRHQTSL